MCRKTQSSCLCRVYSNNMYQVFTSTHILSLVFLIKVKVLFDMTCADKIVVSIFIYFCSALLETNIS